MKTILSFIITAAMMLSLAPQLVFAEEQNMLTDGAIETAESIPDGGWKPVTGAWKSGLGTSVTIDTENVSLNDGSTKSAKITNAAIYQAVSLETGKTYELSFDIYLNEGFDSTKLQWGIFNFNGSWIGTIAGGYNNGTAVTESDFDISKTGEWQSVKITYECDETKNYIVEFFYSGTEGLYVDNVSLILTADEPETPAEPETPETPDEPDEGLLKNYGFENGALSTDGGWKFSSPAVWYSQNAVLDTETVYAGGNSVKISDGAVGQRVTLEAGKSYKLSAYVFSESSDASFNIGFYDGTKTWPMSNAVKVDKMTVSAVSEWIQYSIVLENASAQDYVVGVYNDSKYDIYFDSFVLEEITAETTDNVFESSTVNKGATTGDDGSKATAFVTTITNKDTKDNTVSSVYWEITSGGATKKTGTEMLSGAVFTLSPDASVSVGLMVRNLSDAAATATAVVE